MYGLPRLREFTIFALVVVVVVLVSICFFPLQHTLN